jgi:hypothetical protein
VHIVDMSRIKILFATQGLGEKAIFQGSLVMKTRQYHDSFHRQTTKSGPVPRYAYILVIPESNIESVHHVILKEDKAYSGGVDRRDHEWVIIPTWIRITT